MTKDISQYSSEELMQIAGIDRAATLSPPQEPEVSNLTTEELQRIAKIEPGIYDKVLNLTQQLATGTTAPQQFMEQIPVGLGRTAVGATQALSQALGKPEVAERLGESLARSREDLTPAQRAGQAVGEAILPTVAAPARAIAGGVVGGGLAGLTAPQEDPDPGKRLAEAATGATIGGALGGALQAGKFLGKQVKKLFTASKPEDILARRLPAQQTTELLEQLRGAPADSPMMLPDIAGDEVKGLTRAVGKLADGKDIISDALEQRSKNAVSRVVDRLSKDISDVDNYFGNLEDLTKARSQMAAPLYKKAFEKGTRLDINANKELFSKIQPDIESARRAFRIGDEVPYDSIVMLDFAKKGLDDRIGSALRQGERQQARFLSQIKNELVEKLDKLNPDYKKARQVFSDFASVQNAQEQGLQFSRLRPEELRRTMKNFSPSEKEAFRIGVRENLQKTVTSTAEGADPAKRIFGNQFKRDQLKAIFPTQKSYEDFSKRMVDEIRAANTKFRVLGGSRTDINLADENEFLNTISKVGGGAALGSKFAIINGAISSIRRLSPGITEKNAKQLATILVDKGKSIEALEKILQKERNAIQQEAIKEFIDQMRLPAVGAALLNTTQEQE